MSISFEYNIKLLIFMERFATFLEYIHLSPMLKSESAKNLPCGNMADFWQTILAERYTILKVFS
jgi:hypothetical protein